MKVLVAPELGRLEVGEAHVPRIGPTQVLVRTVVSGVSAGTEKRKLYTAELGPRDERAPWPAIGGFGYMAAGEIAELGADAAADGRLRVGQRVFAGRTWGGHREFIDTEAASVVPLPDDLGWAEAACSYWAVPPLLGILAAAPAYLDDAAVVGLGPLGLMGVQLLARSARRVVGVDPVAQRRALAERFGASAVAPGDDVADRVRAHLPDGPEVVLEVSGTQAGLEAALAIVRPKGRVALVGSQQRLNGFDLFWPLQHSGAQIVPLWRAGTGSVQRATGADSPIQRQLPLVHELLLRRELDIAPLITWVVPPEAAPRAMDLMHRRPDLGVGLAIAWKAGLAQNVEAFEDAAAAAATAQESAR